jgi:hypothetical protein
MIVGLLVCAQTLILILDQIAFEAICILGVVGYVGEIQLVRANLCHDVMYCTWEISDKLGITQEVVQSKKDLGLFSFLL